jgi:hypothetical protein
MRVYCMGLNKFSSISRQKLMFASLTWAVERIGEEAICLLRKATGESSL